MLSVSLSRVTAEKNQSKQDWKGLLFRIVVWLMLEIILNLMGMDDLADYGEFIFEKKVHAPKVSVETSTYYRQQTENPRKGGIKIPYTNYQKIWVLGEKKQELELRI